MARGSLVSFRVLEALTENPLRDSEAARVVNEIHELLPANGSVIIRVLNGRPLYHAHVVMGEDEYVVSVVPTQLNEEEAG